MTMKWSVLCLAAAAMLLVACKDKKSASNEIITTDYEVPQPKAPIAMADKTDRTDVEWVEGRRYMVKVARMAVDSLPKVSNAYGQQFIDNLVDVQVMRADSSVFFHRHFTKSAFANWLAGEYKKNAILQGISFQRAEGDNLLFVAWLNYPESGEDEAVDLQLSVSRLGDVSIAPFDENDRDDLKMMDEEEE